MYQRHDALCNIDDIIIPTRARLDDGLEHGNARLFGVNMRLLIENGATFGRLIPKTVG